MQWDIGGAPFACYLLDPPWNERGGGRIVRGAQRHYPLLTVPQIIRTVQECPVWRPDDDGCHLWLWVTNNFLPSGLEVMAALGFRYVNMVTWGKHRHESRTCVLRGQPACSGCPSGLGRYFHGQTEALLFGVRGRAMVPEPARRPSTLLQAPRRCHSEKPDEAQAVIEAISPAPRVELFCRGEPWRGWYGWGEQCPDRFQLRPRPMGPTAKE